MTRQDSVQRAIRLARAGRDHEATILIRRTLEASPNNASAWAVLAHLVYDPEDASKTIYCLEQILRIQPENLRAREHLHYLTGPVWRRVRGDTTSPPFPLLEAEPEAPPASSRRSQARVAGLRLVRALAVLAVIAVIVLLLAPRVPQVQALLEAITGRTAPVSAASSTGLAVPTPRPRDGLLALLAFPPISGILPGPPLVPTAAPTPTAAPVQGARPEWVDYQPLADSLEALRRRMTAIYNYDLGIAFVDVQTGQIVNVDGYSRYHAMSTFKGPLAAYYLWLLERGLLAEHPADRDHLIQMLEYSANTDTSCVFQRVGGIAPFNDWLAEQGLSRENNFVLTWQEWSCFDSGSAWTADPDWRYSRGDEALGLPGHTQLLACPVPQMPCDKAFAPAELGEWYSRLYRGEVISPAYTRLLLEWMEEDRFDSAFLQNVPRGDEVHVYVKGGSQQANEVYRENFVSEAGLIETPRGTFALAVFMQRNPEWPGTWPISEAARISYEYFLATHPEIVVPGE